MSMYRVIKRSYRAGRVQKTRFFFCVYLLFFLLLGSSAFMRIRIYMNVFEIPIRHMQMLAVEGPKTENKKYGHVPHEY